VNSKRYLVVSASFNGTDLFRFLRDATSENEPLGIRSMRSFFKHKNVITKDKGRLRLFGKPSIVFVDGITDMDLTAEKLLNKLDLPQKIERIAVKMNLCDYRRPETGAVSDPQVLESLLRGLRKKYPDSAISIVENDATSVSADRMIRYLGIDKISEKYSAEVVNLAHGKWITKQIDGYFTKSIEVPVILEDCDLLITHPKLKTHSMTKITCGLKNMFGCYRRKQKVKFHKFLDEAIVDINLALKPNVSIVDANICMEGIGGPCYGFPIKLGLMIAGKDVVAVDAFCARLIGFRPWFVGHIRKAASKDIGHLSYELSDCFNLGDKKLYHFEFDRTLYYLMKLSRTSGGFA